MRGRNRNKGPNPLTRSYESNGPDVKIRGTAQHIADKYAQLARDAQSSGDPVAAENYLQHAEHYYRIIAAAQEQLRQQFGSYQRPFEEDGEEADEEAGSFGYAASDRSGPVNGEETDLGSQPQPFEARGDGERQSDRPQRFDRGDRGERQDRGDRQDRRERFQRNDRPRQDFARDRRRDNAEGDAGALPAFLTAPVRQPISVEGSSGEAEGPGPEGAQGEMNGSYPRRRRRRTRPFGGGEEAGSETGADFSAGSADTPAAE